MHEVCRAEWLTFVVCLLRGLAHRFYGLEASSVALALFLTDLLKSENKSTRVRKAGMGQRYAGRVGFGHSTVRNSRESVSMFLGVCRGLCGQHFLFSC